MSTCPVRMKRKAGWRFIKLFPFVPSEPAGIQHFSLTPSLSRLPSPNSLPLSLPLSLSDVIVSCSVDADAQLKSVCTDPELNVYRLAEFDL